ncbi:hypothetical protein Micbo1qcDRAFT_204354 [Microdochium bolleyi]|uniref:Uncharacterized protein n=1 Tax=Microdochium bolleyi TaxID=196109 RepID=A0A136J5D0_9PEZI|nr:hypothetical protein Micbo1qcDRAFT_204354 [Microdochium bolleyi]
MAVAVPSAARNGLSASLSTPRAAQRHAGPTTGEGLDGDTLLGSPDAAQPALSSPSAHIATKRHPTAAGRIEKRKTTHSSSIAQKLLKLFTSFPSPKTAFFARSTGLDGNAVQGIASAPAGEAVRDGRQSPDIDVDTAMDSIEPEQGSVSGDEQASADQWQPPGEDDEPEFTDWREEQLALNIVLRARHEFTLLPSTWKYNLRGIPIPDSLFYTQTKSKSMRPRIYAMQNRFEYQGETAFRKLIDVHAQIRDLRKLQVEINSDRHLSANDKKAKLADVSAAITSKISRAIEKACLWAESDGDLKSLRGHAPANIMISVLPSTEEHGDVFIQASMDNLARRWREKLGIAEPEREQSVANSSVWGSEDGDITIKVEEDDENSGLKQLQESPQLGAETPKVSRQAAAVQQDDQQAEGESTPRQPPPNPLQTKAPVLFGFVIFKHTLMIVTLDANDPMAPCNIPISLNMAESNQHQWNALAIMVTICWARDLLARVVEDINLETAARMPSEDPDV